MTTRTTVVKLTAASSVVYVHNVVVCVNSRKQQCIQRACRQLNVAASSLMVVVCVVSVI